MEPDTQPQEQPQDVELATPALPGEEAEEADVEPTKNVKNFWERLDEVFKLNVESAKMREKLDEMLEQFPQMERANPLYKSFIFQPERVSISSNDDQQPSSGTSIWTASGEQMPYSAALGTTQQFNSFRVRLPKSLVNVKSIQLLSAVIPNATQNIPNNQILFFYYQIRDLSNSIAAFTPGPIRYPGDIVTYFGNTYVLQAIDNGGVQPPNNPNYIPISLAGIDLRRPNYWDLNFYRIQVVGMSPSFNYLGTDIANIYTIQNRTFTDYADLLTTLQACAASATASSDPNDVNFVYNAQLNKVQFIGLNQAQRTGNNAGRYYYLPCGYEDPNIALAIQNAILNGNGAFSTESQISQTLGFLCGTPLDKNISQIWSPGYNLNLRLGFTWNGNLPNPFQQPSLYTGSSLSLLSFPNLCRPFLRPPDTIYPIVTGRTPLLTANSYPDLVNTSCVRIYTDVALASTDEGVAPNPTQQNPGGLLSVIPVNATNLGVGFYQNNFNNPLTKIPRVISELGIRMVNDQGAPFYLPNSATVILELAVEYY